MDENSLYFRNSVDSDNPSGIGWKKIQIKCRRTLTNESPSVTESSSQLNNELSQDQAAATVGQEEAQVVPEPEETVKDSKNPTIYIETSIYDGEEGEDIYSIYSKDPPEETAQKKPVDNSINLDKYNARNTFSTVVREVEECPAGLDAYLKKIKEQDQMSSSIYDETESVEEKTARTASSRSLSLKSDLNQYNTMNESVVDTWSFKDSKSTRSEPSYDPNEFVNISFKVVAATISLINSSSIQEKWLKKSQFDKATSSELALEDEPLTLIWRTELLNDIKSRNLREYSNIDEISVPYENVSSF